MNNNQPEIPSSAERAREVVLTGLENVASIYSNAVNVAISLYDFRLILGERQGASGDPAQIKSVAKVFLSPPHAKALARLLARQVERYERQFGPIPVPPEQQVAEQEPTSASESEQPS